MEINIGIDAADREEIAGGLSRSGVAAVGSVTASSQGRKLTQL